MKPLTCEMCGSTNLLKQDGVFVCQSCGTKYSVEEAKKMMVEGTVSVEGTVKIDTTSELKNLYEIARRAKESDNADNAEKYYDMILVKDPTSWEANFYVVYYRAMKCKIAEIWSAANSITNCLPSVLTLVKQHVATEQQEDVCGEIFNKVLFIAPMLFNAATSHYESIDSSIRDQFVQEYVNNAAAATDIFYALGNVIAEDWPNEKWANIMAASAWINATEQHRVYIKYLNDREGNAEIIRQFMAKIKKINPEYQEREVDTSSAGPCYVATAVYGSYDCPEVWTLRRFRDFTLAETWYGRAFIRTYYTTSPTLVKWFGHSAIFKKICLFPLDKLVHKLQAEGVKSTPYQDRKF